MGGLRKYMPITYWTVLIGALANAGIPPFAGFFSKESIIEAAAPVDDAGRARSRTSLAMAGVFVSGALLVPAGVLRLPRQGALREPTTHHGTTAHGARRRPRARRARAARVARGW